MAKKTTVSPQVKRFFQIIGRLFKAKERQVPENEDDLGAYPLRMQISAIPERRYLRTARLLAIFTFINIGALIAIAGIFVYNAERIDVQVANPRVVNIYAMDPERKIIQASEYESRYVPAMRLVLEQSVRDYIIARNSFNLDPYKQNENWGLGSIIQMYTDPEKYKEFMERDQFSIINEARNKNVNKEVYIYSLNQTPTDLWEGLIDIFDMPPEDPFKPICGCSDDSKECLTCKEKNNRGRRRFKVYLRILPGLSPINMKNPFGMRVTNYFMIPQIIHPEEIFWNVPSILRPEL